MNIFRKKRPIDLKHEINKGGLKKKLTALDLASLGIGCVIGTGIFVCTGQGAILAGPSVILSYVVAGITCLLCVMCYAELATMFPVAGSTYSYTYIALGEFWAWFIGWDLMLEYIVNAAAVSSGWSATLVAFLNSYGITLTKSLTQSPLSGGIMDLPAILITLFITWLLFLGISESAKVNNFIVAIKMIIIFLFIGLGIKHINPHHYHPFFPYGFNSMMASAAIVFYAFTGFDAVSTAAEETIDPERNIKLGLIICIITIILLYVGVSTTLIGIIPYTQIDVNNALPHALSHIGIDWGSSLVSIGAILGMISSILVAIYGQIRIFMVISRDGLLPEKLSKVSKKRGTPVLCTFITGILTAIVAGFLPLNVIIELTNIGTLTAFIFISLIVIILRKREPQMKRIFKCPFVPYVPIVTIFFCLYLILSLPVTTWIRFAVWSLIGCILYFVYGYKHSHLADK